MRVLVLEKSRLFQKVLRDLLEAMECEVDCAQSGDEGLVHLKAGQYGLIIASQHVFDGSCEAFTSHYLAMNKRSPIILLTSEPNETLLARARDAGITDIFPKSNLDYLADSIHYFVRGGSLYDIENGRVLYIEDSKAVAHAMMRYLKKLNLVVSHYENAERALEDFSNNDYDLVITDVVLDGTIDGVSLVRMIRAQNNNQSKVPILALTSYDDPQRRIQLFRAGVNDYVTKPPVEEELAARVSNLIINKRLLDHVRQQKHTLHEMAMKDQLTGCHNRHSLAEFAPKLLADSRRHHFPLSIMILDLDHFKSINDNHGHTTGDVVLEAVGKTLRDCCRHGDLVCRLGGEEFLVLLPHCDTADALNKAEEVRKNIELCKPADILVTASIGVATYNAKRHTDFDKLYHEADEAVYMSKENGRNKVSKTA